LKLRYCVIIIHHQTSEFLPCNCWQFSYTGCYGQLIAVVERLVGRIPEYINTKLWNVSS
jgi:hypothetical protein